jgi:hypothetical protein
VVAMLLAIIFLILINTLNFYNIIWQTYAIYIIAIAGAESAIGLGILVAFYRLRDCIAVEMSLRRTLSLLFSISSGFFGRKLGVNGSQFITSSLIIITTLLAIIAYFEVGFNSIPVSIHLFR